MGKGSVPVDSWWKIRKGAGERGQMFGQTLGRILVGQRADLNEKKIVIDLSEFIETHSQSIGSPSMLLVEVETARLVETKKIIRSEVSSLVVAFERSIRSISRTELFSFTLVQFTHADEKRSVSEGLLIVQIKLEHSIIGRTEEKRSVDELMRSVVDRQQIEPIDEHIGEIRVQRLKFEVNRSILLRNQRDEMVVEEGQIGHRRDILSNHRWHEN